MYLLKFCGGMLLVICGTFCGIYASRTVLNRLKFFEQYLIFLTTVQTAVSYAAMSAKELLKISVSQNLLSPVLDKALNYLESGDAFETAWRKAFSAKETALLVSKEDRELIYTFGDHFGTGDINGETEKIKMNIVLVQQRLKELRENTSSKRKIYRILGMFAGVVITVLIC